MEVQVVVFRLALAGLLAGLIGGERETHGRSAGLRTNILVGMGAAVFMLVSLKIPELFRQLDTTSVLRIDPARVASYVVAGIGFMGAGVILKGRSEVRGVTTAACLWVNTGIGLCVGCGMYFAAVAATGIALATLVVFRFTKRWLSRDIYTQLIVQSRDLPGQLDLIQSALKEAQGKILFVSYSQNLEAGTVRFHIYLRMKADLDWRHVADILSKIEGLTHITWKQGEVP